jgi:homoserine kinase
MSECDMLIIKVPGSTANLGPGFDSVGMALDLYLTLEVERANKWEVIPMTKELAVFPSDESNYIIQVALQTARKYGKELPPARVKVTSEIPLTRGLGSSAAAIVAGIELADTWGSLDMTQQEKFEEAARIEGHPDNAGASLLGGLVIGCQTNEYVDSVVVKDIEFEIVAVVPHTELLTKESRGVLPEQMTFSEAVTAGAVGNVLVASLISGNYKLAGKMMKSDRYHQPYRRGLVPHMTVIEEKAVLYGAFGVALSGAGPTILCLCEKGTSKAVMDGLKESLPEMEYLKLKVDKTGSQVYKTSCQKEKATTP